MIIREEQFHYVFITQHDHAYTAGEILGYLSKLFIDIKQFETVKFAIHQYNRGWNIPDAQPIINDFTKKPYDYFNYPEKLKTHFCKLSIDQVAQANLYAALLISMFYSASFGSSNSDDMIDFVKKETLRQNYIINKLKIEEFSALKYQLTLIKFCINISLYLCINKVGCEKSKEAQIFKRGFEESEIFHRNDKNKIVASFRSKNNNLVRFNSLIFETDFTLEIPSKVVAKDKIRELGLALAFQNTPNTIISIKLIKEPLFWLY